jgi:hypothetical protein
MSRRFFIAPKVTGKHVTPNLRDQRTSGPESWANSDRRNLWHDKSSLSDNQSIPSYDPLTWDATKHGRSVIVAL